MSVFFDTLDETVERIEAWCEKNSLDNPDGHMLKLTEEFGEVAECLNKNKLGDIGQEIADVFVLTVALAWSLKINLAKVAADKFAIVEARPGKRNFRGQFVKESDM